MRNIRTLEYGEAAHIVFAIVDKASRDGGEPVAVAVVGADHQLLAFGAMDGVLPLAVSVAQAKAVTSAMRRLDTLELSKRTPPLNPAEFGGLQLCFMGGGVAIIDSDGCIGAVGVSGRKAFCPPSAAGEFHDHELATFGAASLNP